MIEVHSKKAYLFNMKNITRNIFLVLLVACYAFVVSAEQRCISDGLHDYGKSRHLAATSKQAHSSGSRYLLKQGKNISSIPKIDVPTVAVLLDNKLWHNQTSQLVRFPLTIFFPPTFFSILYLPRGPTIA
jgi:hypothetical protein